MDTSMDAELHTPESQGQSCTSTERYVRSQSVVSRRIAGETLIVPVRGKVGDLASIYSFNATGTLLWESLASSQSFADLVETLEHEYTVEHEQAEHDVKQFLTDALNAGLIEVHEELADGILVSGHAFRCAEEAVI